MSHRYMVVHWVVAASCVVAVTGGGATGPGTVTAAATNGSDGELGSFSFSLLFAGDANLNLTLDASAPSPFRGLHAATRDVDLFLVNHEATATDLPLSEHANPTGKPECSNDNVSPAGCIKDLRTPMAAVPLFKNGGVDFVALSNNHQVKYGGTNGTEGVRDTLRAFADLPHAGIGETAEEAAAPSTLPVAYTRRGSNRVLSAAVTVFPLCAGPGSSFVGGYDCEAGGGDSKPGALNAQVRLAGQRGLAGQNLRNLSAEVIDEYANKVRVAAARGEFVVVFLHWGCNWDWMTPYTTAQCAWNNSYAGCPGTKPWGCDAKRRQQFGRAVIDAGASVVWGTSSHHIQPIELYKGGVIIYGPGNLIFQNGFEPDDQTQQLYHPEIGMLVRVEAHMHDSKVGSWIVDNVTLIPSTYTSKAARILSSDGNDAALIEWFGAKIDSISRPYNTMVKKVSTTSGSYFSAIRAATAEDAMANAAFTTLKTDDSDACKSANGYTVSVVDRALGPGGGSVISFANRTSDFLFNYNSAYFAPNKAGDPDGLIVRVQATPKWYVNGSEIHFPRSGLAAVRRVGGAESIAFEHVSMDKVFVGCPKLTCSEPLSSKDCEPSEALPCADDPRIIYRAKTDTYYLVYDNDLKGRVSKMATSKSPWNVSSWTFYDGPIFTDHPTTSGASLLVRDDYMPAPDMHYAFVAIAGDAGPMYVGTSHDLIHWNVSDTIWQQGRKGCFDKNGLAAGPPAERLSNGNYLLLYNIDNNINCQSASCGKCGVVCDSGGLPSTCSKERCLDGRCSVGWMILDEHDPTKVLARSEQPVLFAQLLPETVGNATADCLPCTNGNCHPQGLYGCTQTPWVVFSNGLQKLPGKENEFVVWYGAGDSNVMAASIRVSLPQ